MNEILISEDTLNSVIDALNIGYLISSGKEQQRIFAVRHKLLGELQETKRRFSVLEWHDYPKEKPSESGAYLIAFRDEYGIFMLVSVEFDDCLVDTLHDNCKIIAWAKLPTSKEVFDQ